jgi:hypothetical protein
MRIADPTTLSEALQRLRGDTSYVRLSHRISRETEGRLDLDPTGLQRLITGQFTSVRAVDSPTEAVLFGLGMMINGLQHDQQTDRVLQDGRLVLVQLLGMPWAELAFDEIERRAQQITHVATLREFLRECMTRWLA